MSPYAPACAATAGALMLMPLDWAPIVVVLVATAALACLAWWIEERFL